MKREHEVGFPTVGEVIHFLYKASGVLPDKRDLSPRIDEKQRKAVQKALERLAKEEGNFHDQIGEAIKQLSFFVSGYVNHAAFSLAIGEVIMDLLDVYKHVIQDEGTYLSKCETLRWMLEEHWAPAAAFSIAKQVTKFGLRPLARYFPEDKRWYLPDVQDGKQTWPLAKVMYWIYAGTGASQTQFHYPNRKADEADNGRERDLENAQNWIHGRNWPSAAGLDWTFRRAFVARGPNDTFTTSHQEASYIALFVTRCISYAASALHDAFGKKFLVQFCEKFEQSFAVALEETRAVEQWIDELAQQYSMTPFDPSLRSNVVMQWCQELQHRTRLANAEIQDLYDQGALNTVEVGRLASIYGAFPVLPAVEQLQNSERRIMPPDFIQAIGQGMDLSKNLALDFETIDDYETSLRVMKMDALLPWMVPWLHFQIYYRRGDDGNAWIWIQKAFNAARYRAGARQYTIVNHYVELAAKRKNLKMFKKGVYWADYIGIKIRWLREKELNRANLEDAMNMLNLVRYSM